LAVVVVLPAGFVDFLALAVAVAVGVVAAAAGVSFFFVEAEASLGSFFGAISENQDLKKKLGIIIFRFSILYTK
jgi:hypothetical protein